MRKLQTFDFATVVCDGCACRVDSTIGNERLIDYEALIDWKLEYSDWKRVKEGDDEKWFCPNCGKDPSKRIHPGEGRVIIESEPLFGLKCDHCGRQWQDVDSGCTSYADFNDTTGKAQDDGWQEIDGKWYCPGCWKTCRAMSEDGDKVEAWAEVFCSECKYKDDCNEIEPRDVPYPNQDECPSTCQHRRGTDVCFLCDALKGTQCPRVQEWEKEGRAKQEAENAAVLAKCKKGEK